jgi:tetratricopeptide (TPR) repeat protein
MIKKIILLFTVVCFNLLQEGNCQELTVSDSAIISNKAKIRIEKDFISSLNYCVLSINEKEELEMSVNNLCNARRKIFINENAVIENDLDPGLNDSSITKNEMTAKDYYRYLFNNFSNLQAEQNIFSVKNISVSGLKKLDTLPYIKVYFEMENKGIESEKKSIHPKTSQRIAELFYTKPEKAKEAFEVYIMSIRFYDPLIPITDTANNITSFNAREEYDRRRKEGELFHEGNAEMSEKERIARDIASAQNAFNENEFARALQLCSGVLAIDSQHPEALRIKNEIESTQKKIKEDAGQLETLKRNFNHYDTLRQYDDASRTYNEIIKLKPDFSEVAVQKEMDRISKKLAFESEMSLGFNAKKYDEIIKKCNAYIASATVEPEYYYWQGKAYRAKGKDQNAVTAFNKALELAPKYNDVLEELANYYTQQGEKNKTGYNEAVKFYTLLVLNNPQATSYYLKRAEIKNRMGQKKDAVTEDYDEALKSDDKNSEVYFLKGQTLFETGENAKAIISFSQAIVLMPDSGKYYFYRAMGYAKLDSLPQAGKDFRAAIEKDIDIKVRQQILATANTDFKKNKTISAYFNRGMAFYLVNDFKRAKADLITANKKVKNDELNLFISYCDEKLKNK